MSRERQGKNFVRDPGLQVPLMWLAGFLLLILMSRQKAKSKAQRLRRRLFT